MHMNIIALSTSPSRGRNSDTMLDHFIEGVQTVPGLTIEKIYLSDIPIDYYTYENSKGVSPHEQKFGELVEKIKEAKGLVIAAPTYNFSVPGHLKNFIDRLRFVALDMEHKNALNQPVGKLRYLRTYFLVSGGTPVWAQKLLFFAFPPFWLRGVFLYFGAYVMGAFYTGNVQSFKDKKTAEVCFEKGRRFAYEVFYQRNNHFLERIFWRPPQV